MITTATQIADRPHCRAAFSKLCEVIPGGVGSPTRAFNSVDEEPIVVARGEADELLDVDGNRFIDFHCSWGALIHGHAHPSIVEAVQRRAASGTSFGMSCEIEEQLARKIVEHVASVEQVRFVSSGTEATMSAARLARAVTGKDYIIKFAGNYHGHADFFLVQGGSAMVGMTPTSSSIGIPNEIVHYTLCLPYNDVEAVKAVFTDPHFKGNIAGVIIEPIAGNMGVIPASEEFLHTLRDLTQHNDALLIFDEVITGFRVAMGGAQELYDIQPDLTCFGKVMAGGTPAAAFGGRKEWMSQLAPEGSVYQAGTLSGNPLCMEAGFQTLQLLEESGIFEELDRKARVITEPVAQRLRNKQAPACVHQVGAMFTIFWGRSSLCDFEEAQSLNASLFRRFYSHLFQHGVFFPPSQFEASFLMTCHTEEHLEYTRDVILEFIDKTF